MKLKVTFDHPANSWRGPIQMVWYQGGLKPNPPKSYIDVTRVGNGAIFEGTKGAILADFTTRVIIPNNDDGDLTYYKRRSKQETLPLIGGTGQVTQAPPGRRRGGRRSRGRVARGAQARPRRAARRIQRQPGRRPRPQRFPRRSKCTEAGHSRRARPAQHQRAEYPRRQQGRPPGPAATSSRRSGSTPAKARATTSPTAPAARPTAISITPAP